MFWYYDIYLHKRFISLNWKFVPSYSDMMGTMATTICAGTTGTRSSTVLVSSPSCHVGGIHMAGGKEFGMKRVLAFVIM